MNFLQIMTVISQLKTALDEKDAQAKELQVVSSVFTRTQLLVYYIMWTRAGCWIFNFTDIKYMRRSGDMGLRPPRAVVAGRLPMRTASLLAPRACWRKSPY